MQIGIAAGEFGRLVCTLADGSSSAVVTASNFGHACGDLAAALDALEKNGIGECYWAEGGGEYRWVFRRDRDRVRVAVLWTTGVMTGWEHVLWSECPYAELLSSVRHALASAATPAA